MRQIRCNDRSSVSATYMSHRRQRRHPRRTFRSRNICSVPCIPCLAEWWSSDPTDLDILRFGPVGAEGAPLGPDALTARWMDEPAAGGVPRWLPAVRDWKVDGYWVTASLMVGRRREVTGRLVHNLEPKPAGDIHVRQVERELTDREKKHRRPNPHDARASPKGAPRVYRPAPNEPPPPPVPHDARPGHEARAGELTVDPRAAGTQCECDRRRCRPPARLRPGPG
jgi:hypothetical protein